MRVNHFFLLLVMFVFCMPANADDHAPDLADVWIMIVKDGHDEQFEKAFKAHLNFREKNGDTRAWKTYVPILGDDLDHYVVRYCCVTYAEMDEYQAWNTSKKVNDHWNDTVDPHVADYHHYYSRIDLANGNWPQDDSMYKLFGVTAWQPKPGHAAAIEKGKKALSDAAKEHGWQRYWSWASRVGGENQLSIVTPYENFADMEGPQGGYSAFLAKHKGAEAATEMLGSFSDNFAGSRYTVYRLIDDMSMAEMK